jgi:NAD(P)-dependent dehydrogenase (short-subunit alcohol dehydrogenase family)
MGGPPGLTKDGFEVQFGINFLSHALFTKRLLPVLERTSLNHGEARIINLTSVAYTMYSGGLPLDDLKTAQLNIGMGGKWARYGQSKFATVIYTAEMAKRYPKVTTVALHPGVVHTGLIEDLPFFDRIFIKLNTIGQSIPIHEGAYNTLWAATTPNKDNLKSGAIYYPVGAEQKPTKAATDEILWEKLWTWTEEQLNSSCGGVQ